MLSRRLLSHVDDTAHLSQVPHQPHEEDRAVIRCFSDQHPAMRGMRSRLDAGLALATVARNTCLLEVRQCADAIRRVFRRGGRLFQMRRMPASDHRSPTDEEGRSPPRADKSAAMIHLATPRKLHS